MKTRRLTEVLEILTLSATTTTGGEVVNIYLPYKSVYGSILNDSATDNNQTAIDGFNKSSIYQDRVRFYLRYLPITLNNKVKKQFQVIWNENKYYIIGIKHVGNRSATIIELSNNV